MQEQSTTKSTLAVKNQER